MGGERKGRKIIRYESPQRINKTSVRWDSDVNCVEKFVKFIKNPWKTRILHVVKMAVTGEGMKLIETCPWCRLCSFIRCQWQQYYRMLSPLRRYIIKRLQDCYNCAYQNITYFNTYQKTVNWSFAGNKKIRVKLRYIFVMHVESSSYLLHER